MDEEPLQPLLEGRQLPQRLRVMYGGPDVLAGYVRLAVPAHRRVHPAELAPVVREQVLVYVGMEARHPLDDHVVRRVIDPPGPSLPRVVVLHREYGEAVELREVGLDELVRMAPLERPVAFTALLSASTRPFLARML